MIKVVVCYNEEGDKLSVPFPFQKALNLRLSHQDVAKIPQARGVWEFIKEECIRADTLRRPEDTRYYAEVSLTRMDFEWLMVAHQQKAKTNP